MEVEDKANSAVADKSETKQPLKIDFAELFGEDHDEPKQELVVVPTKSRRRRPEKEKKSGWKSTEDDPPSGSGEDYTHMLAESLKAKIERMSKIIPTLSGKLRDGGAKLKAQLQCLQDELKRRESSRTHEVANGYKKSIHSESSSMKDGSKQAVPSSQSTMKSHFTSIYLKKLEDDNPKLEQNTSTQASNAFDREISCMNSCDKSKRKSAGKLPQSKRAKPGLYSQGFSVWKPENHSSRNGRKYMRLNEKLAGRLSSMASLPLSKDKTAGSFTDKDDSLALNSNGSKSEKMVVLVVEEEPELIERKQEAKELPSTPCECKIYYPSRDDPESLEILSSELKCLEPGKCLTSTIMNFYVRFLQESSAADSSQNNFYFFNTYFYSKLQEAVAYQKSDKKAFFMKFRRWWKGVNIFQKAYIFLPINEDNHWSLVIICIRDEKGDSGLTILHLDSLGLHSSSSIFKNIKSLLIDEWKILKEDDVGAVNVRIPERIWKHLSSRIDRKIITVPQQTNDSDCGLFVLYYMKRFIKETLTKRDFSDRSMFGKSWFEPQKASRLRGRIKKILQEEFHKALRQNDWTWKPVCLSKNADTAKDNNSAESS